MKLKIAGLACLLIATTGFGFHNWYLNSKIDECNLAIEDKRQARNRYADAFLRFRTAHREWLLEQILENLGQLFKRSDLLLFKQVRDISREGVKTAHANVRATKRLALIEFAYTVGGPAYSEEVGRQFDEIEPEVHEEINRADEITKREQALRDEIVGKLDSVLQSVQQELKATQIGLVSLSRHRDVAYIVYFFIQVTGIALTIFGEVRTNKDRVAK